MVKKNAAAEIPAVPKPAESPAAPVATPAYDWAVNLGKLQRAQRTVLINDPSLQGQALVDAVKARYILMGGLLQKNFSVAATGKKTGVTVNLAPNDED